MAWYRAIWLSCEKATFLMSKKEEGKCTFKEKVQLRLHLRICDFCSRFQKQVQYFTGKAPHLHEHSGISLSGEKKQEIKKLLENL